MTAPTTRQISYLRVLTNRTGAKFAPPRTRREASDEIARLKRVQSGLHIRKVLAYDDHVERPHSHEKERRSAGAEERRHRQIPSSTARRGVERPCTRRALTGRYELNGTTRAVYAERTDGGPLRLVDRPAASAGRAYLIDPDLQEDGADAIRALTADYLRTARRLGRIPMAADGDA